VPKLKYDLALARHDDIVYGIPDDNDERKKMFLIHGVSALGAAAAGGDPLAYYARLPRGTQVALKLTLDDGTAVGSQRVVIVVNGDEVFTGDWALE
jgi:hypothetical protein